MWSLVVKMCIVYVQQAWSSQQAREVAALERAANRKRNCLVNGYLTARDKLRIVAIYILAACAASQLSTLQSNNNKRGSTAILRTCTQRKRMIVGGWPG